VTTDQLPTFLIIGAQKSGTTSLYEYMEQHPDVFMSPNKEPHFFAFEGQTLDYRLADGKPAALTRHAVTTLAEYRELFAGAAGETARGEASTLYLAIPHTAERIHACIPDARLIAILRNPVDRAWSAYLHARRWNAEPEHDFRRALALEPQRIADRWGPLYHYQTLGYYHDQLAPYYALFPREQIRVFRYDDFVARPHDVLRDAFAFIGVEPSFEPDTALRHNVSGVPRSTRIQALLEGNQGLKQIVKRVIPRDLALRGRAVVQRRNLTRPILPAETRNELQALFQDDIERTAELTGLDLAGWLTRPSES
jgi:hypothetical protein